MTLGPRTVQLDARISRSTGKAARLYKSAYEHERRDHHAARIEIGKGIRSALTDRSIEDDEDIFADADADKDGYISREEFSTFIAKCQANASPQQINMLFDHLDEAKRGRLDMEEMMWCARVFYKVVSASILTDSRCPLEGKQVASVEPGEILELLGGPVRERSSDDAFVVRVRVRVKQTPTGTNASDAKIDTVGWATVAGSDGSAYLAQCPVYLRVAVATPLTSSNPSDGKKLTRQLEQDELVELMVWEQAFGREACAMKHVKVIAVRDGVVGWAIAYDPGRGKRYLELS